MNLHLAIANFLICISTQSWFFHLQTVLAPRKTCSSFITLTHSIKIHLFSSQNQNLQPCPWSISYCRICLKKFCRSFWCKNTQPSSMIHITQSHKHLDYLFRIHTQSHTLLISQRNPDLIPLNKLRFCRNFKFRLHMLAVTSTWIPRFSIPWPITYLILIMEISISTNNQA